MGGEKHPESSWGQCGSWNGLSLLPLGCTCGLKSLCGFPLLVDGGCYQKPACRQGPAGPRPYASDRQLGGGAVGRARDQPSYASSIC